MKLLEQTKIPNALQYLRYKLKAINDQHIHSPFVYHFYNNIIRDETPFYVFTLIESVRSKMLLSEDQIEVHDLGTGGKKYQKKIRSLQFIARHYLKPSKDAQLLFRLVNHFHPVHILELGTSLGLTTMYLASADSKAHVMTVEGCPNTAGVAKKNIASLGIKNIEQFVGEFSAVLPGILKNTTRLDFVYFDGNHRKSATLDYFQLCLSKHHEQTVFVFDDIHWSLEMSEAWKIIQQHEAVTLTIDLFFIGIVFFRKGIQKQHFILKY